ncbi:TPA: type II toxin-antitoxin system VapC family toxin [Candidatus Woesearchaeota archaeon]|nr:hypothetical protein [Candidatus Woesearchaeota archaeon]HIG93221.1 type II toxin-antitoxin system VapC family toxin [Candidatus Woesearchaeota archaeon]HIH12898.1 type II toxin-antitoxin system VapC family toxin [Candidatus Woesearchaeota archaeon]
MKRLLPDTNIYGELILDKDYELLKNKILALCVIHGFEIVRGELRDVPRNVLLEGKKLGLSLLHIYDELIKKSYPLTPEIEELSTKYFQEYKSLGGSKSFDKLHNDFCVVACATIHQIDIVVSEDNKSMLVESALRAYDIINSKEKRRTPSFLGYLEFKRWLVE